MKIHPVEDDLVLGTFGRAFWILDDINPLRELAAKGENILGSDFDVLESSGGYLVSYRSYDGVRFAGQGNLKETAERMIGLLLMFGKTSGQIQIRKQ